MNAGKAKFGLVSTPERAVISIGLLVGVVLGAVGGAVGRGTAQNALFALSSMGLVAAYVVLAIGHAHRRHTLTASGFVILAIGEALIATGDPSNAHGYSSAFAGGVMYYIPGLLLISLPEVMPLVVRLLGLLAALPWVVFAIQNWKGQAPASDSTLATVGYLLLSATIIGWIVASARSSDTENA